MDRWIGQAQILRRYAARIAAFAVVLVLYVAARQPQLGASARATLAARFAFAPYSLPTLSDDMSYVRAVNPSLESIAAWISAVGAGVALNDLDGDGLPNDSCHVDPRTNEIIVAALDDASASYQPFALNPAPLPFDSATMAPMGCLPADFNEDGLTDILVYYWGRTPVAFLQRDTSDPVALAPDTYVPREVVAGQQRWFTNAATCADLDGDGHLDLVIGNYFPDGARILDATGQERQEMQESMSRADNGGRDRLLLWTAATGGETPSVDFREADVLDDQVARGWTLAVGAADFDGDLLPELYFANDFGPDRLLHNQSRPGDLAFVLLEGEQTFTSPNSKILGRDSFKGMGVDFGDLSGDGLLDIMVSNIADDYALEESHLAFINTGQLSRMREGIAPFVDRSESLGLARSGWAWDVRLDDLNNDGTLEVLQATGFLQGNVNRWPELHELAMANDALVHDPRSWPRFQPGDDLSGNEHLRLFTQALSGRYYDISGEVGLSDSQISRGIATADVDGDGDLDFAVANQWQTSYWYRNDSPNQGVSLGLRLVLPVSPGADATASTGSAVRFRPAIGAMALVSLPDGRRLTAQVDGGNGHSGKRSSELHFGLGDLSAASPLEVELHWRGADGSAMSDSLVLTPGRHTIVLGADGAIDEEV
jgi:enediyne biosynthesis protein E4